MAITAKFLADFDAFKASVQGAETSLKNMEATGTRLGTSFDSVKAQILGAFTVGALVSFGREILDAGDKIQKMADQTGLGTDEVQKLQYIAGQSGTSIESLVGAVQNLQVRLGDDNTGAAGAMAKLGIHADAFNKLGTYDQMTALADGIRSVKDPTEQASLAAALFGKTWKEILPAIKSGMKEVGDQAPTMAEETVKALDRVGDAMTRSKQQAVTWGGGLLLAIEGAGFAFGDFLSKFNPEHFGVATSEILKMQGAFNDPDGLKGALASIPPFVPPIVEGMHAISVSVADEKRAWNEMGRDGKLALEKLAAETKAYGELVKDVQKIEADAHVEAVTGLLGLSAEQQRSSQARFDAESKGIDQINKANADLRDFQMKAALSSTDYQIAKIQEHVAAQKLAYTGLESQRGAYNAAVEQLAKLEADALTATAARAMDQTTAKAQASLQALLSAMQGTWQQYQAALDAANPNSVGKRVFDLGPGGSTGGTGRYVNGVDTWGAQTMGRAAGGPVSAGSTYMVGERGPELFTPGANGSITPNGGVTNYITIQITQPLGTPDAIARALQETARSRGIRL